MAADAAETAALAEDHLETKRLSCSVTHKECKKLLVAGRYPEAKGAAQSALLWAVRQTEETLLSVGHRGGNRQKTDIYQPSKRNKKSLQGKRN